jgi:hypothetical protein
MEIQVARTREQAFNNQRVGRGRLVVFDANFDIAPDVRHSKGKLSPLVVDSGAGPDAFPNIGVYRGSRNILQCQSP